MFFMEVIVYYEYNNLKKDDQNCPCVNFCVMEVSILSEMYTKLHRSWANTR
jgi:hypothetical protein